MDIVERLRQRKERIIAANPSGIISMADSDALEAADEIERLREAHEETAEKLNIYINLSGDQMKEIERLREALKLIRVAIENYGGGGKSEGFALGYVDEVARAALKGDE